MTFPKTTCFPSRCGVALTVMKNWEPLVFGPELAMDNKPGCPTAPSRRVPEEPRTLPGSEFGAESSPFVDGLCDLE